MAVNKKKVNEVSVAQVEENSTENATVKSDDMTARFMEMLTAMNETINSLKNELDEQKKKNEELEKKYETQEVTPVMEVTPVVSSTEDKTDRLLEILSNKKSDKEVVIVHNRELVGGLSTSIRLNGASIDFHTLGEQRVLSWQQFEECVSKYHKWFDKRIILLAPEYGDVAERYNIHCVKKDGMGSVTKKDLDTLYTKTERQLEDYLDTLTEEDKGFICSYWLGKCYQRDAHYLNRSKIELLNRYTGAFNNLLASMNFDSLKN